MDRGAGSAPAARSRAGSWASSALAYSGLPPVCSCSRAAAAGDRPKWPRATASRTSSSGVSPASVTRLPCADPNSRRQLSSSGTSSLWITMTSTGRPVMCRAANRSAACDWRSAQCASSRTRIVSPAARTSSRKLCPMYSGSASGSGAAHTGGGPGRRAGPRAGTAWPSTPQDRVRSSGAPLTHTGRAGAASRRNCATSAVFPMPAGPASPTTRAWPPRAACQVLVSSACSVPRPTNATAIASQPPHPRQPDMSQYGREAGGSPGSEPTVLGLGLRR